MTASIGFAPGTGQDEAADEPVGSAPAIVRLTVTTALIAALVFNFVLCFVNTRVTPVTSGSVMLSEMLIITIAMAAALTRRAPLYLLIAAFVSYMMFLFALRGGQYDLKSIRDILIPITFYFAGMRIHDPKLGDRLVLASALIVVAADRRWFPELKDLPNARGLVVQLGDVTGRGELRDDTLGWQVSAI